MTASPPPPTDLPIAEVSSSSRVEWLLLAAAVAAALVPVWSFKYFPSTDGGAHLANADVLLQYLTPAGEAYRKFYQLSHRPLPNSLGHFVLCALLLAFPPAVAEKMLVTAYVIGLPLAVRYALRAVNPRGGFLAILAVPLSLNWILHQGFYNFCCSVALFFVLMGYWLRRRERLTIRRAIVLGVLGLLLYFGHLLSIVLACAAIGTLAAWFVVVQLWQNRKTPDGVPLFARLRPALVTFAALAPAVALFAWFQHSGFAGKPGRTTLALFHKDFWQNLAGLSILISFRTDFERPVAHLTACTFAALLIGVVVRKARARAWSAIDGLALVPAAFVALYFTRGDTASGALFIPQRLIFYSYLTLLPFLAAQTFARWVRPVVAVVALGLTVAQSAVHMAPMRAFNQQLGDFISTAQRVAPGTTLLPLVFSPRGAPPVSDGQGLRVMPFFTAAGYAAIDRHAVDLRNYEAGLDYFPVHYAPAVNPYQHMAVAAPRQDNGLNRVPQRIDLQGYTAATGAAVDYVLLFGPAQAFANADDAAAAANTLDQLRAGFVLEFTSPTGQTQLWRRKDGRPAGR